MPLSADAVNATCSLRNGAETVGGRLVYTSLVEALQGHALSGVACLHAGGYYRGDWLRSAGSEIGSNELALSLSFSGHSSNFWSWMGDTAGLLRGKGVVSVTTTREEDFLHTVHHQSRDKWASIYPDFYNGTRIEIFVMEARQSDGMPMYQRIVEILRQEGAVWVSVTRAIDGFGMARSVRKTGWLWKRSEVPLIVTAVGTTEHLQSALEQIRRLPEFDGYATAQPVEWYAP